MIQKNFFYEMRMIDDILSVLNKYGAMSIGQIEKSVVGLQIKALLNVALCIQ